MMYLNMSSKNRKSGLSNKSVNNISLPISNCNLIKILVGISFYLSLLDSNILIKVISIIDNPLLTLNTNW